MLNKPTFPLCNPSPSTVDLSNASFAPLALFLTIVPLSYIANRALHHHRCIFLCQIGCVSWTSLKGIQFFLQVWMCRPTPSHRLFWCESLRILGFCLLDFTCSLVVVRLGFEVLFFVFCLIWLRKLVRILYTQSKLCYIYCQLPLLDTCFFSIMCNPFHIVG